jgi:hypothetical protein
LKFVVDVLPRFNDSPRPALPVQTGGGGAGWAAAGGVGGGEVT